MNMKNERVKLKYEADAGREEKKKFAAVDEN